MAKKTCIICTRSLQDYEFIKDRNTRHSIDFGYCKDCVRGTVTKDHNDPIDMLRMLNVPYIHSLWEQSYQVSEKETVSDYLKRISLRKAYKDYRDSEFDGSSAVVKIQITDEIRAKWGYGYSDLEYEELEGSLRLLKRIKEPSNGLEEKMYVTTVLLERRYNSAIESDSGSSLKNIKTAYEESLSKLGLDKSSAKDDIEAVGLLIREFEKEAPIPEATRDFMDVDNVEKYINKGFLTNLKRIFGSTSEKEVADLYTNDYSIIPGMGNNEDGGDEDKQS